MIAKATSRRLIAAFFLAFFGLNLVGIFCLSHCNFGSVLASAVSAAKEHSDPSHCDPKPAAHHAEETNSNNENSNIIADVEQCCDPGFGIVTATTKSIIDLSHSVPTEVPVQYISPELIITGRMISSPVPVYRPPPQDRRIQRKLNCVIRI